MFQLVKLLFRLPPVTLLVVLNLSFALLATSQENCLTDRGQILTANIGHVAASGHLVTSLQRGGWDTRPMVRVNKIDESGLIEISRWEAERFVSDIVLYANTAFVAADYGLVSLDLRDPHHPIELDFINLEDSGHLAVDCGLAFAAVKLPSVGPGLFDIVDVSDTAAMERLGGLSWDIPARVIHAIDAAGGIAVIADSSGLLMIDVSDPWRPTELGRWSHSHARDVALVRNLAVVALGSFSTNPDDYGIAVVDLSAPGTPVLASVKQDLGRVTSVAEYGGDVVVGTFDRGVVLINVDDSSNPVVVDRWEEAGMQVNGLATAWPSIALATHDFGLVVLGLKSSCIPPRHPSSRVTP